MTKKQVLQKIASKAYVGIYKQAIGDPDAAWYDKLNWFGTGDRAREEKTAEADRKREAGRQKRYHEANTRDLERLQAGKLSPAEANKILAGAEERRKIYNEYIPTTSSSKQAYRPDPNYYVTLKRSGYKRAIEDLKAQGVKIPEKQYIQAPSQPQQTMGSAVFGGSGQGYQGWSPAQMAQQPAQPINGIGSTAIINGHQIDVSGGGAPGNAGWTPAQAAAESSAMMDTLKGINRIQRPYYPPRSGYMPPRRPGRTWRPRYGGGRQVGADSSTMRDTLKGINQIPRTYYPQWSGEADYWYRNERFPQNAPEQDAGYSQQIMPEQNASGRVIQPPNPQQRDNAEFYRYLQNRPEVEVPTAWEVRENNRNGLRGVAGGMGAMERNQEIAENGWGHPIAYSPAGRRLQTFKKLRGRSLYSGRR